MSGDTVDCKDVLSNLPPEIIQQMCQQQKLMHQDYSASIESQENAEAQECLYCHILKNQMVVLNEQLLIR